jgi:uncharacterized protein YjbI with pentapeptide repeats
VAAAADTKTGSGFSANLSLGTSVLVFGYVAIAVLKQSDAELILPSSTFDVGGLLDKFKDGIPGGAFVAPILQVKLPLYVFYTIGPLLLLALHAWIVFHPKLLQEAVRPLRFAAIWLPPCTIALIAWRFSSYVVARPDPPLLGVAMEALQWLALVADFAIVIFALIYVLDDRPPDMPGASARGAAAMLRAGRYAGLIWLVGLMPSGLVFVMWPVAAVLLAVWLYEGWFVGAQARTAVTRPWYRPLFIKEDLDMQGRVLIASIFVGLTVFPALGRGLDLAGESLVARAPTEIMMAALIVAKETKTGTGLIAARETAWIEYGRGIDLDKWTFDRARFDRAAMAHIRLREANLRSASLDYTNLIKADLTKADLSGASLRYSDMRRVQARDAKLKGSNMRGALAGAGPENVNPLLVAQANPAASSDTKPQADSNVNYCKDVKPEDRTDFSEADLSGADLTDADLRCSILRGAKMDSKTILKGTKLDGANLCAAALSGVDLSAAEGAPTAIFAFSDLTKALIPENMLQANLEGAFVAGTRFKDKTGKRSLKEIKGMKLRQGKPDDLQTRLSSCEKVK